MVYKMPEQMTFCRTVAELLYDALLDHGEQLDELNIDLLETGSGCHCQIAELQHALEWVSENQRRARGKVFWWQLEPHDLVDDLVLLWAEEPFAAVVFGAEQLYCDHNSNCSDGNEEARLAWDISRDASNLLDRRLDWSKAQRLTPEEAFGK